MKSVTAWLVRRLIADYEQVQHPAVRSRYGSLEALTAIVVNVVLCAGKFGLGLALGSVALIGDGVNQLGDSVISVIILLGFRWAGEPGDRRHPFGHGRLEPVITLIVAVLIAVAAVELFRGSVARIMEPTLAVGKISWGLYVFLGVAIVAKEMLARLAMELGRMIDSKTLQADAWNHRGDVLATLLVVAALVLSRYGWGWIDGVGGVVISVIIIYTAFKIAMEAIHPLVGEPPSQGLLGRIEATARQVKGVRGVHDVIVHQYGQLRLISLHVEASDTQSVYDLHDISEMVMERLEEELGASAVVHVDPVNPHHERYEELSAVIERCVKGDERVSDYHDLRIIGHGEYIKAVFDVNVAEGVKQRELKSIEEDMEARLEECLPGVRFAIKAEPPFKYATPGGTGQEAEQGGEDEAGIV